MEAAGTTGLDLKLRRVAMDVKAKDLASAAGRTPAWVSRMESRRTVPAEQAQAYLTALASFGSIATPGEAA